jgi:hypothetical protein
MKSFLRLFVSGIATAATYYFIYWLLFSLILPSAGFEWLGTLGSLLCAFLVARFTWRQTASVSRGLVNYIVLGALVVGGLGFSAGFFGPMIFDPGANQGPLLGIFITGPLGGVIGAVVGAVYWHVRGKRTTAATSAGTKVG